MYILYTTPVENTRTRGLPIYNIIYNCIYDVCIPHAAGLYEHTHTHTHTRIHVYLRMRPVNTTLDKCVCVEIRSYILYAGRVYLLNDCADERFGGYNIKYDGRKQMTHESASGAFEIFPVDLISNAAAVDARLPSTTMRPLLYSE